MIKMIQRVEHRRAYEMYYGFVVVVRCGGDQVRLFSGVHGALREDGRDAYEAGALPSGAEDRADVPARRGARAGTGGRAVASGRNRRVAGCRIAGDAAAHRG